MREFPDQWAAGWADADAILARVRADRDLPALAAAIRKAAASEGDRAGGFIWRLVEVLVR